MILRQLALVLTVPLLSAQDVPVMMHLRIAGPASWQSRLVPTDVGSMFASQQAEPLWRPWVQRLEDAVRTTRADDAAHAVERRHVLDYGGTVHLVAWLDQAEDSVHVPRWSLALIAEPDGHSDMAAIAKTAQNWIERLGGSVNNAWRELRSSAPRVHEGRVLLVLASEEDEAAATRRAESFACASLVRSEVVRCDLDVAAMLGLLRDRGFERWIARELIGPATERIEIALGTAGPRVQAEVVVRFGEGARGLPGAFGCEPTTALTGRVPSGSPSSVNLGLDVAALWRTIVSARAEALETTIEDQERWFEKQVGFDVTKELFERFETGAVLSWRSRALDEGVEEALLADTCLVVPLRAGADVRKQATALLQWAGGGPGEDADGVVTADFGVVRIAVGFGVVCLAVGEERERQVEDVLSLAAERLPATGPGEPSERALVGSLDMAATVVRDAYAWTCFLWSMVGDVAEWPSVLTVAKEARSWKGLLREQHLEAARVQIERGKDLRVVLRW